MSRSARWLDCGDFGPGRTFEVQHGLGLPLLRVGFVDGEGGFGRTATQFLPLPQGVWISRRGVVTLHSHGLEKQVWRREVNGWLGRPLWLGEFVLAGPDDEGMLHEQRLADGETVERRSAGPALLTSRTESTFLFSCPLSLGVTVFRAMDRRTFDVLWERPGLGRGTSHGEKYLIDDCLGSILLCVDAHTGKVEWTFELGSETERAEFLAGRKRLGTIKAGFPSVVSAGEHIVVVLEDSTVVTLEPETGRVTGRAQPPFPGIQLVTDTSVFFLQAFGLSEFDHRTMKETERIEYRSEVGPIYGKATPYPCAFWLTHESVIWTDLNGLLIGVSRQAGQDGKREIWWDKPEGAVMPIGEFPLAYGDYLYRAEKGERLGLYCYRSVVGGKTAAAAAGVETPPRDTTSRKGSAGAPRARGKPPFVL